MKRVVFFALALIVLLVLWGTIPERKKQISTEHFTFNFSKGIDTSRINSLAKVLETNYQKVSTDLHTIPASNIAVNIYAQRWRYVKATGNWTASGSIEGVSKLHFVEQTWTESSSEKVAVHEFTHAVVLKMLQDKESQPVDSKVFDRKFSSFPTWLWEALSVYEAGQFVDPKTLPYLTNGKFPTLREFDSRSKGGKIYECGYTIIEYILASFKQEKLIRLIESYGDLPATINMTGDQFCKSWYAFVKEKYLQ